MYICDYIYKKKNINDKLGSIISLNHKKNVYL